MLFIREGAIAGPIDLFLHKELGARHLPDTLRQLAGLAEQIRRAMRPVGVRAVGELTPQRVTQLERLMPRRL